MHSHYNKGIGLVVVLAIAALVGIGGIAAVQVYNNSTASVETNEAEHMEETEAKVAAAKEDAERDLADLHAQLRAGANMSVDASLSALNDIRTDMARAYAGADAELRAEFNAFQDSMNRLEAEIRAESESAVDTVEEIIASFDADVRVNTSTDIEASGGDNNTNVDAAGNSDTSTGVDDDSGIDLNTNTSIDGSGSVSY